VGIYACFRPVVSIPSCVRTIIPPHILTEIDSVEIDEQHLVLPLNKLHLFEMESPIEVLDHKKYLVFDLLERYGFLSIAEIHNKQLHVNVTDSAQQSWNALEPFLSGFGIPMPTLCPYNKKLFFEKDNDTINIFDNVFVQYYLFHEKKYYLEKFGSDDKIPIPLDLVQSNWETSLFEYLEEFNKPTIDSDDDYNIESDSDDSVGDWYKNKNIDSSSVGDCKLLTKLFLRFAVSEIDVGKKEKQIVGDMRLLEEDLSNHHLSPSKKDEMYKAIKYHKRMMNVFKKCGQYPDTMVGLDNKSDKKIYRDLIHHVNTKKTQPDIILTSPTDKLMDVLVTRQLVTKIKNKDGKTRYDKGHYPKKSCFICRGWETKYHLTSYECIKCGMPLCNPQTAKKTREKTCVHDHHTSMYPIERCGGDYTKNCQFPVWLKDWRQVQKHFDTKSKIN
jgi:hypothetical protein